MNTYICQKGRVKSKEIYTRIAVKRANYIQSVKKQLIMDTVIKLNNTLFMAKYSGPKTVFI